MSLGSVDRERKDKVAEIAESHTPAGSFPVLTDIVGLVLFLATTVVGHTRVWKPLASYPCLTSFIVPCNERD
jgi:hypothetical protein